jgi:hypothetical protein
MARTWLGSVRYLAKACPHGDHSLASPFVRWRFSSNISLPRPPSGGTEQGIVLQGDQTARVRGKAEELLAPEFRRANVGAASRANWETAPRSGCNQQDSGRNLRLVGADIRLSYRRRSCASHPLRGAKLQLIRPYAAFQRHVWRLKQGSRVPGQFAPMRQARPFLGVSRVSAAHAMRQWCSPEAENCRIDVPEGRVLGVVAVPWQRQPCRICTWRAQWMGLIVPADGAPTFPPTARLLAEHGRFGRVFPTTGQTPADPTPKAP